MATVTGRAVRAVGLLGVALTAMIAGHCGGYQLSSWLPFGSAAASQATGRVPMAAHEHHVHAAAAQVHADHGHMLPMASGAFLLAVVGCLGVLIAVRRRAVASVPSTRLLLTFQLAGFVLLELSERLPAGTSLLDTVTDRRVLLGLFAQPVVAWLVHRLCRRTVQVLSEWAALSPARPTARRAVVAWVPLLRTVRPRPIRRTTRRPRGPPLERFAHT